MPVSEQLLEHGDRIDVGGSQFVFLIHEDVPVEFGPTVNLDDSELRTGVTVSLTMADALYLQPARPGKTIPTEATWARDLNALFKIRIGVIRKDLYYRLNVVSLKVPPLRERQEDIPLLAAYFAEKYAEKSKRHVRGISGHAQACLLAYDWPGNVRELENAIERAVVLGSTDLILPEDLPETVLEAQPSPPAFSVKYHEAVRESKRQVVRRALDQAEGDYSEAAKFLGLHVNNLHRLIRNLDLKQALKKARQEGVK